VAFQPISQNKLTVYSVVRNCTMLGMNLPTSFAYLFWGQWRRIWRKRGMTHYGSVLVLAQSRKEMLPITIVTYQ